MYLNLTAGSGTYVSDIWYRFNEFCNKNSTKSKMKYIFIVRGNFAYYPHTTIKGSEAYNIWLPVTCTTVFLYLRPTSLHHVNCVLDNNSIWLVRWKPWHQYGVSSECQSLHSSWWPRNCTGMTDDISSCHLLVEQGSCMLVMSKVCLSTKPSLCTLLWTFGQYDRIFSFV